MEPEATRGEVRRLAARILLADALLRGLADNVATWERDWPISDTPTAMAAYLNQRLDDVITALEQARIT